MADENLTRVEQLNAAVEEWGRRELVKMQQKVRQLTLSERRVLLKSLKSKVKLRYGMVERINFGFVRHGIFVERGFFGIRGQKGRHDRTPKPWLAPVLDAGLNDLAEILANEFADMCIGNLNFFVPGVFNRRIKL